jgi:hypothetical protein
MAFGTLDTLRVAKKGFVGDRVLPCCRFLGRERVRTGKRHISERPARWGT